MKRGRYHHGDLERALMDAALELVAEKGEQGFTLTEAARRAGVSPAAPYRHFEDKEALLVAVASEGFRRMGEVLDAASAEPDPEARLYALGEAYVRFAVQSPALSRVMFQGVDKQRYPELQAAAEGTFQTLVESVVALAEAGVIRAVEPLSFAISAWTLAHGTALLFTGGKLQQKLDEPSEVIVRRGLALLVAGAR
jgi:AcrR family transcriptional regulator